MADTPRILSDLLALCPINVPGAISAQDLRDFIVSVNRLFELYSSTSYANDAAAASGGVVVGQIYRNGNAVMVRLT